ncbi:uncharacterized protein VP01_649g3, partial [Puccinia sorghi]
KTDHSGKEDTPPREPGVLLVPGPDKQYSTNNNCISHNSDPLKIEFCHLANSKKPIGKGVCPPWIREEKEVDKAIQNRAAHNVLIDDEGDKDGNTKDKRNGIGAPITLSPNDENDPSQLNHSHHMDNSAALNQTGPNSSAGLALRTND